MTERLKLVELGRPRPPPDLSVTRQQLLVHRLSPGGMFQLSSGGNEETEEEEVYKVVSLLLVGSLLIINTLGSV